MAEVRKVETGVGEDGEPTYEYQLGAEIGNKWVPFLTKSAGYVEHLVATGRAAQEQAPEPEPEPEPKGK